MSLEVIGAGFGRTGTLSLKLALEDLGYRPCYHMEDVVGGKSGPNAGHLEAWHRFSTGAAPMDWRELFRHYRAAADFPACLFYRELMHAFPDAPVVLTVREPEKWAASVRALHTFNMKLRARPGMDSPPMRKWNEIVDALVWGPLGDMTSTEHLTQHFTRSIDAIVREVPADRLLVFDVRQGWGPLCKFLRMPIPTGPFPHVNERQAMDQMLTLSGDELRKALAPDAKS